MKVGIDEISESYYNELTLPILFENIVLDRMFGILHNVKPIYKLGWQSTNIKPFILEIQSSMYIVGIDLNVAIFDVSNKDIYHTFSLDTFFYTACIFNKSVYIMTELEVVVIDLKTFAVEKTHALPDLFKSVYSIGNHIVVQCVSGELINIE